MEVDLDVYGLAPVLKVADKFTDRCFVHLQLRSNRVVEVRFCSKDSPGALESIAGEFCNEILDQRLREIVSCESEPVRNLILAHALSRTELMKSQPSNPQNDDLGTE